MLGTWRSVPGFDVDALVHIHNAVAHRTPVTPLSSVQLKEYCRDFAQALKLSSVRLSCRDLCAIISAFGKIGPIGKCVPDLGTQLVTESFRLIPKMAAKV